MARFTDFIVKPLCLYQKVVIEALRTVCSNASAIAQVVRNVKHSPPLLLHVQPTHQDINHVTSSTSITSAARAINISEYWSCILIIPFCFRIPHNSISTHLLCRLVGINSVIASNPLSVRYCCQHSRFPFLYFSQSFESILLIP